MSLVMVPVALAGGVACGAPKPAFVPNECHHAALGPTVDREVTGEVDCHEGGVVRNDLSEDTEAR